MPDRKKDAEQPSGMGSMSEEERVAALVKAICEEMDDFTPEQLERLYAAIALMGLKQDE